MKWCPYLEASVQLLCGVKDVDGCYGGRNETWEHPVINEIEGGFLEEEGE